MPATIRDAVLQRAAGQMTRPSEVFAVLKARALPNKAPKSEPGSPNWPAGSLPPTKVERATTSRPTQRLDVSALAGTDPDFEALRAREDGSGSLLDGLRRRKGDTAEPGDGVPESEVEDSTNPFDHSDSTDTRELRNDPKGS